MYDFPTSLLRADIIALISRESAARNQMQKLTKTAQKTLKLRLSSYWAELQTCATEAQERCVREQIETTAQTLARGHW